MSSPYDESLLASAPKATKSQIQDGYNPNLLIEKNTSTPAISSVDPEMNRHSPIAQRDESALPLTKQKAPFYRTRNGIIVIVVVAIVIIAAVVGGAVGGTKKKGSKSLTGSQVSSLATISTISTSAVQGLGTFGSTSISSTGTQQTFGPATPFPSATSTPGQGITR